MKRQLSFIILLSITAFSTGLFLGCATPAPVVVEEPKEPAKADPYDLFSGVRLEGEGPHRVQAEPMAIESARLLVEVLKIRVTEMENPDGGSEKETSCRIRFTKGEKSKVMWLDEGESATVLGVSLKLLKGGDSYVEKRQEYFPFALLEVK